MRRVNTIALLAVIAWLVGCAPEGDPSAFVTFNVPPDGNCTVSADRADVFIPIGLYDIAPGGNGVGPNCARPYFVHLLINSYLQPNADMRLGRSEPNILQVHSAEVRLLTINKEVLSFDREAEALPNPFLVTTNNSLTPAQGTTPSTGIASVEAIPVAYARQLDMFDGSQILAEIQIFGTTTGDIDVDFRPFVFPIEICDGCLTSCLTRDILDLDLLPSDIVDPDDCADNSGADGRVCIDSDC